MRNMEHWRAVGAFMLWTGLVQLACAAWVLVFEGGRLSRIAVHSLVLVANNTGILAPVVLEAAVGPAAAAVGMLATIALYFQQLPVAMVLFELDRMGAAHHEGMEAGEGAAISASALLTERHGSAAGQSAEAEGGGFPGTGSRQAMAEQLKSGFNEHPTKALQSERNSSRSLLRLPSQLARPGSPSEELQETEAGSVPLRSRSSEDEGAARAMRSRGGGDGRSNASSAVSGGGGTGSSGAGITGTRVVPAAEAPEAGRRAGAAYHPRSGAVGSSGSNLGTGGVDAARIRSSVQRQLTWDSLQPQEPAPAPLSLPPSDQSTDKAASAAAVGGAGPLGRASAAGEPSLRHAAQLVAGNVLMWTTGAATVVSMMGLHSLLDPAAPTHVAALGFVEGTLSWLARCSVPVSLFAMGLWTASNAGGDLFGRSVRGATVYLAIKMLVLPWLMVFVNSVLGLSGRLGRSLVVLTCVPVGQNAFLVTEQYGEGAREVMQVLQVGLLLMLPHVATVMAVLRWVGLYEEDDASSVQ